jgi:predicted  nucleic acid-binding Zn-ribbon protein
MHELAVLGEKLEQDLQLTKARVQLELSDLKAQFQANQQELAQIRIKLSDELLARFDAKLARGIAVGRLQKNTCTACNMSITATSLADLHQVPQDEVASCPECQAILIR